MKQIDETIALRLAPTQYAVGIWPLRQPSGSELNIVNTSSIPVAVGSDVGRFSDPDNERYPYYFKFKRNSNSIMRFNTRAIPTGSYTLKFSMRMSAKPTAENQEIISSAYARSTDAGIRIWVDTTGGIVFSGCYKNSSNYSHMLTDTTYAFDNSWVDYMFSFNATTREVKLWKNGVLFASGTARYSNNLTHTYALVVGRQPDSSYARYFSGDMCDIAIYRTVLTPDDFIISPSFIENDGVYKFFDGVNWETLGVSEPTTNDYIQQGMLKLSPLLDKTTGANPLGLLSGPIKLHTWTNGDSVKISVNRPTPGQDLIPTIDTPLVELQSIDSISVVGSPSARVVFSVDGGTTWRAYKDGAWIEVALFSDGIPVSSIPSINLQELLRLAGNPGRLRIGYHLNVGETITSTTIKVTSLGAIKFAPAANYEMSYSEGVITYNIKVVGNYFINYLDAVVTP